MERKIIGISCNSLAGGGGERLAADLASQLHAQYNLKLFLLNNTNVYSLPDNVPVYTLGNFEIGKLNLLSLLLMPIYAIRYKNWCKVNNIDTVISILYRTNWIACLSKMLGNRTKIICYEVSTPSKAYNKATFKGKIGHYITKTLYKKADVVITNSYGGAEDLKNNFDVNDVQCIRNPLDIQYYQVKSAENTDVQVDKAVFNFFSLSRFKYPKDQATIVKAFGQMNNSNCHLYLSGDGEELETVKSIVAQLNLINKVTFLGFHANPFAIMSQCDCFVFSSYHEGFPNSLLEAMICNLPIISSDCTSGPREIVAPGIPYSKQIISQGEIYEGSVGYLYSPGDAEALAKGMDNMIDSPLLRQKFAQNFSKALEEFSYDNTLSSIEKLL